MQIKVLEDLFDSDEEELLVPKGALAEVQPQFDVSDLAPDSVVIIYQGGLVTVFNDEYEVYVPNYQDSM